MSDHLSSLTSHPILDALNRQRQAQRDEDVDHVGTGNRTIEFRSCMAPSSPVAVIFRQMTHERSHVGKRRKRHDLWDGQRTRQGGATNPRPFYRRGPFLSQVTAVKGDERANISDFMPFPIERRAARSSCQVDGLAFGLARPNGNRIWQATKKKVNLVGRSPYRPLYRSFWLSLLPSLRFLPSSSLPWFSWTFDAVLQLWLSHGGPCCV